MSASWVALSAPIGLSPQSSYSVYLDGTKIISKSFDPEYDVARYVLSNPWLVASGGPWPMVEVRDGITGKCRSRFNAKALAPFCIEERNSGGLVRRKWRSTSARLPLAA